MDVALRRAVAPWQGQRRLDGVPFLGEALGKAPQPGRVRPGCRLQPRPNLFARPPLIILASLDTRITTSRTSEWTATSARRSGRRWTLSFSGRWMNSHEAALALSGRLLTRLSTEP